MREKISDESWDNWWTEVKNADTGDFTGKWTCRHSVMDTLDTQNMGFDTVSDWLSYKKSREHIKTRRYTEASCKKWKEKNIKM